MRDTDAIGKYFLVTQIEKLDNVHNKVNQICEKLKNQQPLCAQESFTTFEHHPFIKNKISIKNKTHNLIQHYLQD